MTSVQRSKLDELFRCAIRGALADGIEATEIVYLLTRLLPELCDRQQAHGHIYAAFDLANRDSDRAMPFKTGPFELEIDLHDIEGS